jgi:hypothetical protein
MALPTNYPLNEQRLDCYSSSIGATPAATYLAAPFRGKIAKFGGVTGGTITTANATVTVAVNGTTIGTITILSAGAAAGQVFTGTPTTNALAQVNEDDVISFTPAGASGASIPGTFFAVFLGG